MPQRPPHRPPPPPLPDLATYRPYDARQDGPPPTLDQRYQAPASAPVLRRATAKKPTRSRWLRAVAWTVGGLGALTAAGIIALIAFAPVDMLREQLAREIEVRTGRVLKVAGRTSLSVFPSLGLTMEKVTLSTPPGMGGAPFLEAPRLELQAALWPLIERRVVLERLVLTDPKLDLRIDARGRQSWDFAGLTPPATIMVAQAGGTSKELPTELKDFLRNATQPPSDGSPPPPAAATQAHRASRASIPDITLGDVRLLNGTVRYRDERSGMAEEIRAINARVSAKSLATPLDADGDLSLRGERVAFQLRLAAPRALLEERPSKVSLALAAPGGKARYDGSLTLAKGAQLDGALNVDAPSVRELAKWAGVSLQSGGGGDSFTLQGDIKTGPTWVAMTNAKAKLDAVEASGDARIVMGGPRPRIEGTIRLGALDLNRYLPENVETNSPTQLRGTADLVAPPKTAPRPSSPQVRGFTQRSGWSDKPIDLSPLRLLDAKLRFSVASLTYQEIKFGSTQGGLTLEGGTFRATIDDMRLYGGRGRGTATIEPSAKGSAGVAVNLTVDGVSGLPLLKDAAGFDWIDGKGKVQIAVAGGGISEQAIMETLNGKAEFSFTNGAIVGFNFPELLRGLGQGRIGSLDRSPTARTEFSEAGASFQIRNGVAETKDLRAISPAVRVMGAGTVSLGPRQIDVVLRPRLSGAPSVPGGGGSIDLSALDIPIKVKGSWERPQITPDISGVLKGNAETFREIGRQLQQGRTDGIKSLIDQFRKR